MTIVRIFSQLVISVLSIATITQEGYILYVLAQNLWALEHTLLMLFCFALAGILFVFYTFITLLSFISLHLEWIVRMPNNQTIEHLCFAKYSDLENYFNRNHGGTIANTVCLIIAGFVLLLVGAVTGTFLEKIEGPFQLQGDQALLLCILLHFTVTVAASRIPALFKNELFSKIEKMKKELFEKEERERQEYLESPEYKEWIKARTEEARRRLLDRVKLDFRPLPHYLLDGITERERRAVATRGPFSQ